MNQKSPIKNRSERAGNLVSIQPYDNTSRGYRKEKSHYPSTGFGIYLSIAVLVFLFILFTGIYELVIETWTRLK